MNNLKEAILERLINCGKKNKRLKAPVMILITLFLILFHGIRNFFMQFKLYSFRQRVLASALCVCLVMSSMPSTDYVLPVLAAENSEDGQENGQEEIQENTHDSIREIVSFTELSDEVKEQTVAVGTPLESLGLPDTLTAVCRMANEKDPEDNQDPDKEQNPEDEDKQPGEGDGENPEEGSDEGNEGEPEDSDNQEGDESEDSDNEGEGNRDESGDSDNEGEGNENESGDSSNEEEKEEASESNKGADDADVVGGTDEGNTGNKETVETQETFNVTLPEYYAMPDELPEVKELFYEETVTIDGITWESVPEYDSKMEGVYLFTPVISDGAYTLAEDVRLPEISVTVAEAEIMLAEEELPDVSGSTTPVCGVISSDTTWEQEGTLSNGELIIEPGVTLTINDEVHFSGTVTIKGGGTILKGNKNGLFRSTNRLVNVTLSNITIDGASILSDHAMIAAGVRSLTVCDGSIIRNCMSKAVGGAITNSGDITIRDTNISNCSAIYGGAIAISPGNGDSTVLTMENTSIINCSADYAGGAIENWGCSAILENITIENCLANKHGGAIYMDEIISSGIPYKPDLTIKDGKFINNRNTSDNTDNTWYGGGCIWAGYGILNIYDGKFTGNTSARRGGVIYQGRDSVINISGGYFEGNTCTNKGYEGSGAVYASSDSNTQLVLSSDAHFCGDDVFGTDGIMLDGSRRVLISDTLNYPVTVYVAASDGRVIAEGKDHILSVEEDLKKIKFVDIGSSGKKYYTFLDEANNQIKLVTINPGYGYYINYISNGAQGMVVDNKRYEEGDTITVKSADELSREGYHFIEWNTRSNGRGTSYQPGDEITVEDDITLYAIFDKAKKVTATFYSGADNYKEEISAEINEKTQTASLTAPFLDELQGYDPVGWNRSASGDNTDIVLQGDETEISQDTSFYGVYKKDAVLAYDLNYGSGYEKESVTDTIYATVNEDTINYKYPILPLASAPRRAGYTFTGWNTAPDGTSDTYEAGKNFELRGDTTLYAQWEIGGAQYTVEHYLQDVSGDGYTIAEEDTEILSGTAGEMVNAAPKTYRGFTENITHESRRESGTVADDGSLVLRLYYDRNLYVIAFDLNGGTGTWPEAQELRYGTLLQDVDRPEKPGYTFRGWYFEPGTEGKAWDFDKTVEENTEKQSQVLYAGWEDDIAPVLMQAEFNEGYKSFFDWLIRKKDLIITIPIIEEGSGVKWADYELSSLEKTDSGKGSEQAQIIEEDGRTVARITISNDFMGTVSMTCSDNAGNISADKTLTSPGGGAAFIVEDNAPEITFSSRDGNLSDSFYDNVTVTVSVNDEGPQGNADTVEKTKITGGIASVNYSTDNGAETAVEGKGFESGIVPSCDFSVKISGVGEHILKVTATDNAGNENTSQARIKIAQKPTEQKTPVKPVSGKKTPELNPAAPNSLAPVTAQFMALADTPQPLKTTDPARDNEPRTEDTSRVEVYATIAMISGLLYVLLYFAADKTGMTQEEKEQFLSFLISWAKRGGKLRRLFATAVIFLFLVYYHSIGKCKEYDVKKIQIFSYNGRKVL